MYVYRKKEGREKKEQFAWVGGGETALTRAAIGKVDYATRYMPGTGMQPIEIC